MSKQKLFSVTAADCKFDFFVASGDGGQNRQKRNTACRCTHEPSGAVGKCSEGREQHLNRRNAFKRMCETVQFQNWVKMEAARLAGDLDRIEQKVEKDMDPKNMKVEVHDERGCWKEME